MNKRSDLYRQFAAIKAKSTRRARHNFREVTFVQLNSQLTAKRHEQTIHSQIEQYETPSLLSQSVNFSYSRNTRLHLYNRYTNLHNHCFIDVHNKIRLPKLK